MFVVKTYPEFSWSLSRHYTLTECKRRYAYQYYVSHNGWLKDAPPEARHAYRLKNITNLEMFFGSIVHETIKKAIDYYLQTNQLPEEITLREYIRKRLNNGFLDSTRRKEQWFKHPNKTTMFHEIYYKETNQLPTEKVEKITHRLQVAMQHFLSSQTVHELKTQSIDVKEAEKFRVLRIGQLKVYVVLDLLYYDRSKNHWVIVDWKTGKQSEEDLYQLALYVLYLMNAYSIPHHQDIVIRNEYLLEGDVAEQQIDEVTLEKVQELIGTSVDWMYSLLEDPSQNQPLPLEEFPKTDNKNTCRFCNFYELCYS